jgi:hypothetical protein
MAHNERKTSRMKVMIVNGLSFNLVVALERELLYYSDQLLYRAAQANSLETNLEKKFAGWESLAEAAIFHQSLHEQILGSLRQISDEQDSLPEEEQEGADKETLTCRFPAQYFDVIARAMGTPFLDLQRQEESFSYWRQLEEPEAEKEQMKEQHRTIVKCLKSAEGSFVEIEDEEQEEEAIEDSSMTKMATMPRPKIMH